MIEIKFDGTALERALEKALGPAARHAAMAKAATRTAAAARTEIIRRLPEIFDRPTSFTLHSVRYAPATPESRAATVYISEDANRGLSPRKYLGPEIMGGPRRHKRSERALIMRGLMEPGQFLVPAQGLRLDAHGNIPGSLMVRILSRVGGMVEAGFTGNATAKTKERLTKRRLAVQQTGTDYFVAHGRDGRPIGIWQLVSKGHVRPVLVFADRAPDYHARFHLQDLVEKIARERFAEEMRRALLENA